MKHHLVTYLSVCIAWVLYGCSDDCTQILPDRSSTPTVEGTVYLPFSRSASTQTETSLPDGSTLSFYASGALSASGLTLTLTDGKWTGNDFPTWDVTQTTASVGAVYPSLPSLTDGLYQTDGALTDVLYDYQENISQANITLGFKHLFSKATFQLSATLNAEVESIDFTPSTSVAAIQVPGMQVSLSDTELHTTTLTTNDEGSYSVIVPPATDMSVAIAIHTTSGTTLNALLGSRNFESGHEYRCSIKKESNTESDTGIYTVEDFIAFTHLINNETYNGKTLADFGSAENGVTTYRLKNDLTFSSEQSKEIYAMMNNAKGQFSDCFDGENHTLYNIVMPTQSVSRTLGLFTTIASTGTVKNLRIDNFSYRMTTEKESAGILCGLNFGTIDNCHITNSSITGNGTSTKSGSYREIGGLSYSNRGVISNSSCTNVTFSGKYDYFGGLTNVCFGGKILNCYIANCNFQSVKSYGSITYQLSDGSEVYNCYTSSNAHSKTGYLIYKASKSTVANCFYQETETNSLNTNSGGNSIEITAFSDETTTILGKLNDWATTQGPSLFPGQTFLQWESATTPPFRFAGQ